MQNLQRPWLEIRDELLAKLKQCDLDTGTLSAAVGVSYHAIWRFRKNGIFNRCKNALRLCTFFKIDTETAKAVAGDNEGILRAVRKAWDGSESHAELLAELILSTAPFSVTRRKQP